MTTMHAALDERFSDPGTQALPWADVENVLTSAELFWITTARPDDRPHQTPLVGVWLDGCLHFSTGPGEQKAHNLAHNDQVLLTTGCNTWDRGVDVVVEGRAERVDDRALLERIATAWADKWDGRLQYEVDGEGFRHTAGGTAWVYRVKPDKLLAFTKGTFTHTRYVATETHGDGTTRNPAAASSAAASANAGHCRRENGAHNSGADHGAINAT